MDITGWVTLITAIAGIISSVVAFYIGRRKRKDDTIEMLENRISNLARKNDEQMAKILEQNELIVQQNQKIGLLTIEINQLRSQITPKRDKNGRFVKNEEVVV